MITLQMMKGTGPYNQMQRYIAGVHKGLTPQQRAGKFTALLKQYVKNVNTLEPYTAAVKKTVCSSFKWDETPEGWKFWNEVDHHKAVKAVAPKPPVVEQPAKVAPQAPALVWPKGFVHCRVLVKGDVRFFNKEGQIANGQFQNWVNPQNFEHWQKKLGYIKRPETPPPIGLQWEEGYTHANEHDGRLFQFNDKHYVWKGEVKEWDPNGRKEEWFAKRTTIQRYPDNQPLILDNPPQAPVRPVEQRIPEPVGQPVQPENVAVKAPVDAPKAKQKVGWW